MIFQANTNLENGSYINISKEGIKTQKHYWGE